jgi:hypothetical protein
MFTPQFVTTLTDKANAYLRAESKRPRGDARRVRAEIRDLTAKRLVEVWEASGGKVEEVIVKLKKHKEQPAEQENRLREIAGRNENPAPITTEEVEGVLADLRALLQEDTAAVAPILRELTGPVVVNPVCNIPRLFVTLEGR